MPVFYRLAAMDEPLCMSYRQHPIRCCARRGEDNRYAPEVAVTGSAEEFALNTRYVAVFQYLRDESMSAIKEHVLYLGTRRYATVEEALEAGAKAACEWIDRRLSPLDRHGDFAYEIFTEGGASQWVAKARLHGSSDTLAILDWQSEVFPIEGEFATSSFARQAGIAYVRQVIDRLVATGSHDQRLAIVSRLKP